MKWEDVPAFMKAEVEKRNFHPNPVRVHYDEKPGLFTVMLHFNEPKLGRVPGAGMFDAGVVVNQIEFDAEPANLRVVFLQYMLSLLRDEVNYQRGKRRYALA